MRLPFDRPFLLVGPDWRLSFQPGAQCAWQIDNNTMTVTMDVDGAREFAQGMRPWEGQYRLTGFPSLNWNVQPTLIRDANGDAVE